MFHRGGIRKFERVRGQNKSRVPPPVGQDGELSLFTGFIRAVIVGGRPDTGIPFPWPSNILSSGYYPALTRDNTPRESIAVPRPCPTISERPLYLDVNVPVFVVNNEPTRLNSHSSNWLERLASGV